MGMYGEAGCFVLVTGRLKAALKKVLDESKTYDSDNESEWTCDENEWSYDYGIYDQLIFKMIKLFEKFTFYEVFGYPFKFLDLKDLDDNCSLLVLCGASKAYQDIKKSMTKICELLCSSDEAYPIAKSRLFAVARFEGDVHDHNDLNTIFAPSLIPDFAKSHVDDIQFLSAKSPSKIDIPDAKFFTSYKPCWSNQYYYFIIDGCNKEYSKHHDFTDVITYKL